MSDYNTQRGQPTEDIIDPELPICDSHHHLWNSPDRHYLLKELFEDIGGGHNIVKTVFVESESAKKHDTIQKMQPVQETRFVHDITTPDASRQYGKTRVAAGIVGFVDFRLGAEVLPVIEAHLAASDRLRGFRQICSWDVNSDVFHSTVAPGLLKEAKFREGLARLKGYDLTFETFLYHPQLKEFIDLARTFPDISMILDHLGGPLGTGSYVNHEEVFQIWKSDMAALSECPNVYMKLGGLGMPICGFGWSERPVPPSSVELAEATSPYFLHCIERFGTARCMFESNFPVDKMSYSYTTLWNAFKRICRGFSQEERGDLFFNSAAKVYRLWDN